MNIKKSPSLSFLNLGHHHSNIIRFATHVVNVVEVGHASKRGQEAGRLGHVECFFRYQVGQEHWIDECVDRPHERAQYIKDLWNVQIVPQAITANYKHIIFFALVLRFNCISWVVSFGAYFVRMVEFVGLCHGLVLHY